jgi:hypothetical protein
LRHLNEDGNEDDHDDKPEIELKTAFTYVKDAFGLEIKKHEQLMEKVKKRPLPAKIDENEKDSYTTCSRMKKLENIEMYSTLLKVLLHYEIFSSKIPNYCWSGKFSYIASTLLTLFENYLNLKEPYVSLSKWKAFCEIHKQFPLNLMVFHNTLDAVVDVYENKDDQTLRKTSFSTKSFIPTCFGLNKQLVSAEIRSMESKRTCDQLKFTESESLKIFWKSRNILYQSFIDFIKNLHQKTLDNDLKVSIVEDIFKINTRIERIIRAREFHDGNFNNDVKQAIIDGVNENLDENIKNKKLTPLESSRTRIKELIRMVKFADDELKIVEENYSDAFKLCDDFCLPKHVYMAFDNQLAQITTPIVKEICKTKQLNEVEMAKMFELYQEIKKFYDKGVQSFGNEHFKMKDYPSWFSSDIEKDHQIYYAVQK